MPSPFSEILFFNNNFQVIAIKLLFNYYYRVQTDQAKRIQLELDSYYCLSKLKLNKYISLNSREMELEAFAYGSQAHTVHMLMLAATSQERACIFGTVSFAHAVSM